MTLDQKTDDEPLTAEEWATIKVQCDECQRKGTLAENGWVLVNGHRYCPQCASVEASE